MSGLLVHCTADGGMALHRPRAGGDFSYAQDREIEVNAIGYADEQQSAALADALLRLVRQDGIASLAEQPGAFSAVISTPAGRFVVSDHDGNRPLFVSHTPNGYTVGSVLCEVAAASNQRTACRRWEPFLLGYEFVPAPDTLFEGIQQLPPGRVLELLDTPNAVASPTKDTNAASELYSSEAEVADSLAEAFERSFEGLPERVGVLLGGFDSALIVAMLKQRGHSVETFTFRYAEPGYTQPFTETLAQSLDVKHHWVDLTPEHLGQGIKHYAHHFHQPAGQAHYLIFTAHACRAVAAAGIEVCLTGDGCDGLFLGYPTVARRVQLISTLAHLPAPFRRGLRHLLSGPPVERIAGQPARMARNILCMLERDEPQRGFLAARTFDEEGLRHLRAAPDPTDPAVDIESTLARLAAPTAGMTALRRAYTAKSAVGLNKAKLSGAASASGILVKSPFLHHAMIATARRIPDALLRGRQRSVSLKLGKESLMFFARRHALLPDDIILQPKRSPVHAPVDLWYRGPLRAALEAQLTRDLPFAISADAVNTLFAFPAAQRAYRRWVTLDQFTSHQIGLLASYSSFFRA